MTMQDERLPQGVNFTDEDRRAVRYILARSGSAVKELQNQFAAARYHGDRILPSRIQLLISEHGMVAAARSLR